MPLIEVNTITLQGMLAHWMEFAAHKGKALTEADREAFWAGCACTVIETGAKIAEQELVDYWEHHFVK